ncbi:hypothetical protein U14_04986 [Candidatus Moduliflexus flocculans]|uniref:Uncharacterized protein n=1 Tax=Candidatus Moduliflexus flocculans TaxID=1499966 RepID=A0A081BQN2_9BACT|nr:hypothetical protein U14_04986 [Candidatus Moduliflexus flocculans]
MFPTRLFPSSLAVEKTSDIYECSRKNTGENRFLLTPPFGFPIWPFRHTLDVHR